MTKILYSLSLLFLLANVWSVTVQAAPDESHPEAVTKCHFLTDVKGHSGYGKNTGWQAIARQQALRKAENTGATHVVWQDMRPIGAFNGEAIGRAYDCGR